MGVIGRIAPVAQEQDIFVICTVAHWAGCGILLLLLIFVEPCLRVELDDLFLVLDFIS